LIFYVDPYTNKTVALNKNVFNFNYIKYQAFVFSVYIIKGNF